MSNEYSCCTHNPDVPAYLRCPDVRSKRPEVNVYLDSDTIEKRLDALEESQEVQDAALEKAGSDIVALEQSVADIEKDQKEQNESLYKHGDRIADLEDVIKHKVLPYIGEDDDRDDTQEARIGALESAGAEQAKQLSSVVTALNGLGSRHEQLADDMAAHRKEYEADHLALTLLDEAHTSDVRSLVEDIVALRGVDSELKAKDVEQDGRLGDLEHDLANHISAAAKDREELVSSLIEQFRLAEEAVSRNSDDIAELKAGVQSVQATQSSITKTVVVDGEEKAVVPYSSLYYANDKDGNPVMFSSSWQQYQKIASDNRNLILTLQQHDADKAADIRSLKSAMNDASANFEDIQTVLEGFSSRIAELEAKVANLEALIEADS